MEIIIYTSIALHAASKVNLVCSNSAFAGIFALKLVISDGILVHSDCDEQRERKYDYGRRNHN